MFKYFQPGFDSNNPLPFGLTFELKITHRPAGTHKFVSSVCCVYCINRVVSPMNGVNLERIIQLYANYKKSVRQ
jgi:hypothetical protein